MRTKAEKSAQALVKTTYGQLLMARALSLAAVQLNDSYPIEAQDMRVLLTGLYGDTGLGYLADALKARPRANNSNQQQ